MSNRTVVYVEKEKFLRDMMEKAVSSAGIRIYTYADNDCMHFIQDLEPELVVLDAATIDDSFIGLLSTEIPVILVGFPNDLEKIAKPVSARIEKPIGPFDLVAEISRLINH